MIFKLTTKDCTISPGIQRRISQHLKKITQDLPNTEEDLIVFRLVLRRNIDKYHPHRNRPPLYKNYARSKPALAHFEGSMYFRLDKKQLYAHFKGLTIGECVDRGFELIWRQLQKYEGLHFSSDSKYPDHNSIRKENLYFE